MPDHARSTDGAVQAQLDRLWALSPGADILGLDRIERLLGRLGDPHLRLPPVFHVAGTNGKGSTCAFLRAALEAAGHKVHVYTSPHLVRFNERIRVAGTLIDDAALATLLAEVLDVAGDLGASFFEVTTAAAFLHFARVPADACIVEVGLGGRLDATNVLPAAAACGIAQLGLDHQAFLGDTLEAIAAEKAGIAKPGVPLVTMRYPPRIASRVRVAAEAASTPWLAEGEAWAVAAEDGALRYRDAAGTLRLPRPALRGAHQAGNAGLAVAMLRHQRAVPMTEAALRAAMGWAEWPARLQRLGAGPLADLLPADAELWLDGGHNPAAARELARFFARRTVGRRFAAVLGMLANKDLPGFLEPFAGSGLAIQAAPVADHAHHDGAAFAAAAAAGGLACETAADVPAALRAIAMAKAGPLTVLIGGSLYLAGEALRLNGTPPT